jgi:hypothetical protein
VLEARERSSDCEGKASDVSLVDRAGLWGNSNESPLAKRRGLSMRVEFEESGESGNEGVNEDAAIVDEGDGVLEESGFDIGCKDGDCDGTIGAGLVGGGVGMLEVTEGLPWAAKARTTAW